jgi:hypothetical protein
MLLRRTTKGSEELRARTRELGLRERGVLFLVNTPVTAADLVAAMGPQASGLVQALVTSGHLEVVAEAAVPAPVAAPAAAAPDVPPPAPAIAPPAPDPRRSLAAARMFLFDVVERMFVRRSPEVAARFRDLLREARDGASMVATAQELLDHVEEAAGPERAATVRDRLAELLPEGLEPPVTTAPSPLD